MAQEQKLGSAYVELRAKLDRYGRELRDAQGRTEASASRMNRAFDTVRDRVDRATKSIFNLRNAAIAAAGATGLFLMARRSIEAADSIAKMADAAGVSTTALQEIRFAAGRAGVEVSDLDRGLVFLSRTIGNAVRGQREAKQAFDALGISLVDASGKIRSTEEVFDDVVTRFGDIEDAALRSSLAQQLFGRGAISMTVLLRAGSRDLAAMREEAHKLGLVLEEDLLRAAERTNDKLEDARQTLQVGLMRATLALSPVMEQLAAIVTDSRFIDAMENLGKGAASTMDALRGPLSSVMDSVAALLDVFNLLPGWMQGVGIVGALLFGKVRIAMMVAVAANAAAEAVTGFNVLAEAAAKVDEVLRDLGITTEAAAESIEGASGLRRASQGLRDDWDGVNDALRAGVGNVRSLADRFKELDHELHPYRRAVSDFTQRQRLLNEALDGGILTLEQHQAALSLLRSRYREAMDPIAAVLKELDEERKLLSLSNDEREIQTELMRREQQLRQAGIALSAQDRAEIRRRILANRDLAQAQEEGRKALEEQRRHAEASYQELARSAEQAFERIGGAITEALATGKIAMASLGDIWRAVVSELIQTAGRLAVINPILNSVFGGARPTLSAAMGGGTPGATGGGFDLGSLFNGGSGSLTPGLDSWAQNTFGWGQIGAGTPSGIPVGAGHPGMVGGAAGQHAAAAPGLLNGGSAFGGFASLGNVLGVVGAALPGLMSGNYVQAAAGTVGAAIGTVIAPGIGTAIGGMLGNLAGSFFGSDGPTQKIQPQSYGLDSGNRFAVTTPFRGFSGGDKQFDGSGLEQMVLQADTALARIMGERITAQIRDMYNTAGRVIGELRDNKQLSDKHVARFLRDSYAPIVQELGGDVAERAFRDMAGGSDPNQVLAASQQVVGFLAAMQESRLFQLEEVSQVTAAWDALHDSISEAEQMAARLGQSLAEVRRQGVAAEAAFRKDFDDSIQRSIATLQGGAAFMRFAFGDLARQQKTRLDDAKKIGADIVEVERLNLLERLALLEQFGQDALSQFATDAERSAVGIMRYGQEMAAFAINLGQAATRAAQQYRGLTETLRGSINSLLLGPLSNLNFQRQREIAEREFESLAAAALDGNMAAMAALPEAGRELLRLTSEVYGNAGESYTAAIERVIAVQSRAAQIAEQNAREQQAIADHAGAMAEAFAAAMKAVGLAIADGTLTQAEVEEIRQRFGAVTDIAVSMGPAGDLFAGSLENVANMLVDGILSPDEISTLMDSVALFNMVLRDGLLSPVEIAVLKERLKLTNELIVDGFLPRNNARVLRENYRLIAALAVDGVITNREVKLVNAQMDLVRLAWTDGVISNREVKLVQLQMRLFEAALLDGVISDRELRAIEQQMGMIRHAYLDGTLTAKELQLIERGTNGLIKQIEKASNGVVNGLGRIPNEVDKISDRINASLDRLLDNLPPELQQQIRPNAKLLAEQARQMTSDSFLWDGGGAGNWTRQHIVFDEKAGRFALGDLIQGAKATQADIDKARGGAVSVIDAVNMLLASGAYEVDMRAVERMMNDRDFLRQFSSEAGNNPNASNERLVFEALLKNFLQEVPGFAAGGQHGGGLRLVGEHGPELEVTGPARIFSAPDTARLLGTAGQASANDNREIVRAIDRLGTRIDRLGVMLADAEEGGAETVAAEVRQVRGAVGTLRDEVHQDGLKPRRMRGAA